MLYSIHWVPRRGRHVWQEATSALPSSAQTSVSQSRQQIPGQWGKNLEAEQWTQRPEQVRVGRAGKGWGQRAGVGYGGGREGKLSVKSHCAHAMCLGVLVSQHVWNDNGVPVHVDPCGH